MADSFLDSLGAAEAQRRARVAPEDALWEAIAQGRASAEQCDAARIEEPERFAAFSPLDAAAREAVHARVAAALARGAADAGGEEDNVVALAPRRAQVRWQRVAMFAAPLLAAAALVLMLRPPAPQQPAAAMGYALEVSGGLESVRGAAGPEVAARFGAGSVLEVVLRPASPVGERPELRGWLRQSGGPWTPWEPAVEWSADGAARIRGDAATLLGGASGTVELRVAVGRPGAMPTDGADAGRRDAGWEVLEARLQLEPSR
jgi:hypothetical protein